MNNKRIFFRLDTFLFSLQEGEKFFLKMEILNSGESTIEICRLFVRKGCESKGKAYEKK